MSQTEVTSYGDDAPVFVPIRVVYPADYTGTTSVSEPARIVWTRTGWWERIGGLWGWPRRWRFHREVGK